MTVKPDIAKRIAELIDGDSWQLADMLVEEFPPDEFGDVDNKGTRTGLYDELREYEAVLARDYGIVAKATTLRIARATALAWPGDRRQSRASYEVHKMLRGVSRETEMKTRLRQAEREGLALSKRMLSRFRYDDNPPKARQYDERMRKAIAAAVRREMLGGILTKRDDWWNATNITDQERQVAVRELRALASAINKAPDDD